MQRTVNPSSSGFGGSNPSLPTKNGCMVELEYTTDLKSVTKVVSVRIRLQLPIWSSGGTGRHASLRNWCESVEGSIPSLTTKWGDSGKG